MKRHFLDVETTSLNPKKGEICEIAIITVYGRFLKKRRVFHSKVMPTRLDDADPKSLKINGFNKKDWASAPTFRDIAPKISDILRDGTIVAHNVEFDHSFIREELRRVDSKLRISYKKFDTKCLVYEHLPIRSSSMKAVRDFFGISHENAHTALKDALDLEFLFNKTFRAGKIQRLVWSTRGG